MHLALYDTTTSLRLHHYYYYSWPFWSRDVARTAMNCLRPLTTIDDDSRLDEAAATFRRNAAAPFQ